MPTRMSLPEELRARAHARHLSDSSPTRKLMEEAADAIEGLLNPTEDMVEAGCSVECKECHRDCEHGPYRKIFVEMVKASPMMQKVVR